MRFPKKTYALMAAMLMLTVTLSGCVNVGPTGLTLKLTDPTPTELDELWVKIVSIEIYPAGDSDGGIEVFEGAEDPLIVDLLDTVFPTTVLVVEDFDLPPGDYDHFKLYLGEIEDGDVPGYDVESGYEALAVDYENPEDWFMCVVPPGKFNVHIYDPMAGENSYFTKVEGEAVEVTIDFQWNGNMAKNEDNNLNPTGKAYVGVVVLPTLTVTKTGPDEIYVGDDAVYTITVEVENAVANNVIVTDTIPSGMTYDDSSPGYTSVDGDVYTWNLGSMDPADTTSSITITLTLTGGTAGETYTNTVRVTCDEGRSAIAEAETDVEALSP